ncbi:hypothetical protein HPP92_022292 [Vanilla planifolia]|uniref:Werner Syndrome-like exonuclease n=1 Tax=Vanilla planifolia TaxID=51239 RepID=A0A835PX24_VANPL|nr:hypothetical protein HPP92_022292 [Vanilla planifolia]
MCDPDWDDDAEEELQLIEAAYTASKRRSSDPDFSGNEESSSTQRRRLPGWAYASPPSEGTERVIRDGNNNLSSRFQNLSSRVIQATHLLVNTFTLPKVVNSLLASITLRAISPSKLTMKLPTFTFSGHTVYSRTTAEVEKATTGIHDRIGCLKHNPNNEYVFLGFDLEWKPIFKRGEKQRKTAVLQICVDSFNCYVMHIIHSGIPTALKLLLEDPSIKKLLKPNKIRLGNWEAYALSKEQINYAATDAFASWYLYQVLKSFPDPKPEN